MIDREAIIRTIAQFTPGAIHRYRNELNEAYLLWQDAIVRDKSGSVDGVARFWQEGSLGLQLSVPDIHASGIEAQVIAVDGSQIYADRHMGSLWYLIHVGAIELCYVQDAPGSCKFHSYPFVYTPLPHESSDNLVDVVRLCKELFCGFNLLKKADNQTNCLLMLDGALPEYTDRLFFSESLHYAEYANVLDTLCIDRGRYVGYISAPQARGIVRFLLGEKHHASSLTDRDIMRLWLKPGCYSTTFMDRTKIASDAWKEYVYWHNGYEVVRIEMPMYLSANRELLASIMHIIQDQIEKGMGYPLCLAEAHRHALVSEADRLFFYQMIDYHYQKQGEYYVLSQKNAKKKTLCA